MRCTHAEGAAMDEYIERAEVERILMEKYNMMCARQLFVRYTDDYMLEV